MYDFPDQHPLLRQSLFLDTETTGLHRASSIHQAAFFDLEKRILHEYQILPHLVMAKPSGDQDEVRLVTKSTDPHQRVPVENWSEVLRKQLHAQGIRGIGPDQKDLIEALKIHNDFLYRHYPELYGGTQILEKIEVKKQLLAAQRIELLTPPGPVTIDEFLKAIPGHLKGGYTLWIANAPFESKQIGAQLAAADPELRDKIVSKLETQGKSFDPFYVTGVEVNRARTMASFSGDWTGVYRAMLQNTPGPDEVAVRDILDVTKAMMSYGKKLGLFEGSRASFGGSIDIQARVISQALGHQLGKELHLAGVDAAIHEPYVLAYQLHMTEAMRQVYERTPEGLKLLEEAQQGRGAFAAAANVLAKLNALSAEIQQKTVVQRLARAKRELLTEGEAVMSRGWRGVYRAEKLTVDGRTVKEPRPMPRRVRYTNLADMAAEIRKDYEVSGYDFDQVVKDIDNLKDVQAVHQYERQYVARLDEVLDNHAGWSAKAGRGYARRLGPAGSILRQLDELPIAKAGLAAGAVAVALGAAYSFFNRPTVHTPSIVSYNYQDWLDRNEGMRHDGPVGQGRRYLTDFGSPYQGPMTSMEVLANQELLQERENWLRAQYGAVHYDPAVGIMNVFRRPSLGSSFIRGLRPMAAGEFQGFRNTNKLLVLDIDPNEYSWELEDPDTIVLRQRGLVGMLSRWMGSGSYTFRLEGIDSPETQHSIFSPEGRGYHAPQPGADAATAAARKLLEGKSLQLVINPQDVTYGRQIATVIADGRNYNLDVVRQGHAAFLPFGKERDSMLNWDEFEKAEAGAYEGRRGIWAQPWAQVYMEASKASGNRITFNTFTRKERIVSNATTFSLLTTMEAAQEYGAMTADLQAQARRIGQVGKDAGFKPDRVEPYMYNVPNAPHKNYLDEQLRDLSRYIKTHGGNNQPYQLRSRNGVRRLDSQLALDTMGTTTSEHTRRRPASFDHYDTRNQLRKQRMAAAQRQQNNQLFQSPIGHHRM